MWTGPLVAGDAPAPMRLALAVTEGPVAPVRLDPLISERGGELPAEPIRLTALLPQSVLSTPLVDAVPHLVHWDPKQKLRYADTVH